ncbi:DNA gyrase subunit A [Candidatus Omnitrophus magneticus]|uniref:DNA gyrase subunit A n=1 Tax=Candidatus Omnitrophus magneticus TaxID=1609969 RepID=A0A0F0CMN0_9BACT|nr:DNA gyrase subunit A [Candidatus Omnitrophus magneticus]
MYTKDEKIIPVHIEEEMKNSYINYAMSVIVGRALPDARDGLKPVHRRILYAMKDIGLVYNKAYKKCARIVGEVLGKYHPHGDSAVYDSLVRMVQDFSLRYPLVDGQGNFGSVDGDPAAAMRYTEARLEQITNWLLEDLEKNTVDWMPNFDGSLEEPLVLPAIMPNLLVNGSSGIAVGMATNIPPHNLGEIVDAVCFIIDNPKCKVDELLPIVKGPDFPTGALICGRGAIRDAYKTGKGLLKVHAKMHVEQKKQGKESIVVTEIPYQVCKSKVITAIADLVKDKKIEGISDIRDESDKEGMRIVVEVKKGVNTEVVTNQLYKHTQLRETFGVIMLALDKNQPRIMNLKEMLDIFIAHRKEVIIRRTKFDLAKAEDRAHILEGLKIAINNLDEVIQLIKSSKDPESAKLGLMAKFKLSEKQSLAILAMRLQQLTNLETKKIEEEYKELLKLIEKLKGILASEKKIMSIIKEETLALKEKFGDARRTEIADDAEEINIEDLIAEEDMVITVSHAGYIKRFPVSAYRQQKRGGKGVTGAETKEEDFIEHLFVASTHDYMLIFTSIGKLHWLKVHEIPQVGKRTKGKPIVNLLELEENEQFTTVLPVREFKEGVFVMMATEKGTVKKTELSAFSNPRKAGIIAVTLEKGDKLIGAVLTSGQDEICLATKNGKAIRFNEEDIRPTGRTSQGVRGISLRKEDKLVGMVKAEKEATIFTVTNKGFGKRTDFEEYRLQSRGGSGVINIKVNEKIGYVVGAKTVREENEIMLISKQGMVVRVAVKDMRKIGRATQGVIVIRLNAEDELISVANVFPQEEDDEVGE